MPLSLHHPSGRRLAALLVFLATLGVSAFSLTSRRQLGALGGLTDEWQALGANLAVYGTLGMENEPWVLRPPGYPALVALVLKAAGAPNVSTVAYRARVRPLIYAAHALVLASTATLLFAWLSGWLRPGLALAAALVFGVNSLTLVLVGMLHYALVHLLGLVASMWALQRAFQEPAQRGRMLLTGVLLGLVTLVRPVTLLLPAFAFVALALQLRGAWRPALRAAALLALGMAAVVLPWTARNYAVSGRLIPVNLQAGIVWWAATEKALPWDPDHYLWYDLGPELLAIHTRVTGAQGYDIVTFARRLPELEAEYRREAIANLRERPSVYARNVARVLWASAAQTSTALPRGFVRLQRDPSPKGPPQSWFTLGPTDELGSPGLAWGLRLLGGALTALGAAGLLVAARARDAALLGPLALGACVVAAHAVTHLDLLHHYLRLPFAVVFAFYALDRLAAAGFTAARGIGLALAAASAALTVWTLLPWTP
jgi:hypothetical protein